VTFALPIGVVTLGFVLLVWVNERYELFSSDRFPSRAARYGAYAWMAFFAIFLTALVVGSSTAPVEKADLSTLSFWSLFSMHLVLVVFLVGWWLLAGRPGMSHFLNLRREEPGTAVMLGVAIGVGGWAITIALAMAVGAVLSQFELLPQDLEPSPVVPWMAALPAWQKATIVFSAMTVEEAFFRGWMQKRFGLLISTVIFVVAHAGYGQPLMMIGITIVSVIIGITFYRTKNLVPCIVAHGVFDAIQLFILVPLAVRFSGLA
jgi:uncharacterized protein